MAVYIEGTPLNDFKEGHRQPPGTWPRGACRPRHHLAANLAHEAVEGTVEGAARLGEAPQQQVLQRGSADRELGIDVGISPISISIYIYMYIYTHALYIYNMYI